MSKLEKALQHTASDLRQKNEQIVQLKGIVAEQQNSLRNDQDKVREIEESRAQLQQQMVILEEEINRERNTAQVESTELQQRLQEAKDDIDERTRQINELSSTLSEVHKDMKHSSASIVELEQLLQQSRTLCDKKTAQAQTLDQALKETQKQLSATTKKNGELEERLRQMESEFTATADRNAQLDNEVNFWFLLPKKKNYRSRAENQQVKCTWSPPLNHSLIGKSRELSPLRLTCYNLSKALLHCAVFSVT